MKIMLGRFFIISGMMFVFCSSNCMENQKAEASQAQANKEHAKDGRKRLKEIIRNSARGSSKMLLPYYIPVSGSADVNLGWFKSRLRNLVNYLMPPIRCPHLTRLNYPENKAKLEDALFQQLQSNIDEENKISRQANGCIPVVRRLVGGGVFGELVGLPLLFVGQCIAKMLRTPMARSELKVLALAIPIIAMVTTEIMFRICALHDCYKVINDHRQHLKDLGFVAPKMAQQLKARAEFQHNQAAHRLIDQITDADE